MKQVYVKPNGNLICRHPETFAVLPVEGGYWPDSAHTRRALRGGDIVLASEPVAEKPAATPITAAKKRAAKKEDN